MYVMICNIIMIYRYCVYVHLYISLQYQIKQNNLKHTIMNQIKSEKYSSLELTILLVILPISLITLIFLVI